MSDLARHIASRVAPHLRPGEIVNLGIGIPTIVADLLEAITQAFEGVGGTKALAAVGAAGKSSDPMLQDVSTKLLGEWMTIDAALLFGAHRDGMADTDIDASDTQRFGLLRGGDLLEHELELGGLDGAGAQQRPHDPPGLRGR